VNASACALMVKHYPRALADDPDYAAKAATVGAAARDLGELVAAIAPRLRGRVRADRAGPIAFHPPCTLQHGQRLAGVVESALRTFGFDLRPAVRDANLCCGSAGAYSVLEPAIATALRDQKLRALEETGAATIASANVGCILHLGAGTATSVRHWIEILADALEPQ
jgi:glycolate oxidase iron-sulfur subunit